MNYSKLIKKLVVGVVSSEGKRVLYARCLVAKKRRGKVRKLILLLALLCGLSSAANAAQPSPQSGKFDYYVFSLSWQPSFCETHQDKKECNTWKQDDFDTKNLVLHGLWPSKYNDNAHRYGYCGVSASIKKLDNASNWCSMAFPDLSQGTIDQLNVAMPGYQSCLENHEWYKHGVCSGLEADSYFATAASFTENFADTKLGALISSNVGKTVGLDAVMGAAQQDFGGQAVNLRYFCQSGTLSEVRLYLKKALPEDGKISADLLVAPDKTEKSTCPKSVQIDQFGAAASAADAMGQLPHLKRTHHP